MRKGSVSLNDLCFDVDTIKLLGAADWVVCLTYVPVRVCRGVRMVYLLRAPKC